MTLRAYLDQVFSHWRLVRPEVAADIVVVAGNGLDMPVAPDPTVAQALTNLLNNNAADGRFREQWCSACFSRLGCSV